MVAVASTLKEFSILWREKVTLSELYLTNPNSKSLQLKMD